MCDIRFLICYSDEAYYSHLGPPRAEYRAETHPPRAMQTYMKIIQHEYDIYFFSSVRIEVS